MKKIFYFYSSDCGACDTQKKILDQYAQSSRKNISIKGINLKRYPNKFTMIQATPTWVIVDGKGPKIKVGVMNKTALHKMFGKSGNSFGETLYENINNLSYYGKNFPDGQGFSFPSTFYKEIENKWGTGDDALKAGIGGYRSLGPDKTADLYSSAYLNDIRMAHPSGQLGTALALNRECNQSKTTSGSVPGLVTNSQSPQIVNSTGFGRRSRMGSKLYRQMGPAYEIGNQYLIDKDTGKQLYSGALQDERTSYGIDNKNTYIGQAKKYNPIGEISSFFGRRKTKQKPVKIKISIKRKSSSGKKRIGEGSTLTFSKKNKIKVKN